MNIEALQEKVNNAQEKVNKAENLIEKYKKQKEQKIIKANSVLEKYSINERYEDIKDEPNLGHRFYEVNRELHYEWYYAICDINDKESGIQSSTKKLVEAKEILKNWKEKLGAEEAHIQYIQDSVPDIIKEFLEEWKKQVMTYYINKAKAYPEDYKEYKKEKHKLYYDILKETVERLIFEDKDAFINKYCYKQESRFYELLDRLETYNENGPTDYYNNYSELVKFGYRDPNDPRHDRRYIQLEESWEARYGDNFFRAWYYEKFNVTWLNTKIEEEKKNKLLDLMARVTKVTGTITDATGLHIEKGDINGIIIGDRGKAKVQTIGAGGYNDHIILDSGRRGQCYHYRVLINEIK